jgi:hypothetical protein
MWRTLTQKLRALPAIFWLIAAPGLIMPGSIGIGLKVYLQSKGYPTVPWEYILHPGQLLVFIVFAILWGIPHMALGIITTNILRDESTSLRWATRFEKRLILACAFIFGTASLVTIFFEVFRVFDPNYLFVPLQIFYVIPMAVGALVGYCIVQTIRAVRGRRSAP